ncbi:MAG: hypothetical protein ACRDY2_01270 [Acidimicrobiales bacterium]
MKFVESVPADKAPVAPGWTESATYRYLVPTTANMAHLRLSIPAGFTEITPGSFHG